MNKFTPSKVALIRAIIPAIVLVAVAPAESRAQADVSVEKILAVWKAREDKARTLHFEWAEQRTYPKGSLPSWPVGRPRDPRPAPPEDVTHENHTTLSIDGDLMRFSNSGPQWEPTHVKFVIRSRLSVFDGQDDKSFDDEPSDGSRGMLLHKLGFVRKADHADDVVDYHYQPILLTYRPFHKRLAKGEWHQATERGVIQGRACVVITRAYQTELHKYWVDPERDYRILKYDKTVEGKPCMRFDITYRDDPSQGWVPAGWSIVKLFPQTSELSESVRATVTEQRIGTPLPPPMFRLDYPPGTLVRDRKRDTTYIVEPDGGRRVVTEEEMDRAAPYEELLQTESGQAGLQPKAKPWTRTWLPIAAAIIVIAAVAFFLIKRLRASKIS